MERKIKNAAAEEEVAAIDVHACYELWNEEQLDVCAGVTTIGKGNLKMGDLVKKEHDWQRVRMHMY